MSLQAKFTVLLSVMTLIVVGTLGASILFGRFLEDELVRPFRDSAAVLKQLADLRTRMEEQRASIPSADEAALWQTSLLAVRAASWPGSGSVHLCQCPPFDRARLLTSAQAARLEAERLADDSAVERRVGITSVTTLAERVTEAEAALSAWTSGLDARAAERAARAHDRVVELASLMERRVLGDAPVQMEYLRDLRTAYRTLTWSSVAAVALVALLGVMLLRRWVIVPVRRLHDATLRIGRGEFEHRVPVAASDELGVLSAEVNRMTGLIKSMQEEAVERERLAATGQMVRRIVHNLRNPLAAIRSLAELSRRRASGDESIRKDQNEIIAAVDRFNGWLGDLLNVNAPLRILVSRQPVTPWLEGILAAHRPLAHMRSVELVSDFGSGPSHAAFDPRHLEHALVALVTNAIQASPAGGRVTLACRQGSASDPFWCIEVRDEGPGIPPDDLPKIFRPYFTTKRDGTGIGLAVAQQVVQGHGGEIRVQTALQRGTAFFVRVPTGLGCSDQPAEISQPDAVSQFEVTRGANTGGRG